MFIAALFIIAKEWNQHKCLSTDEWINKMQYIHAKEYYLAIRRNEVELPWWSVVKTLYFHCMGCGFDPWWGN